MRPILIAAGVVAGLAAAYVVLGDAFVAWAVWAFFQR
jgi:hypothetical protein